MTDNTENLKSSEDSNTNNIQLQDSIINEQIAAQDQMFAPSFQ